MTDTLDVKVTAIVAMSENNCIGKDNDLPWHIPEDLKRFKALTLGKPVIMGRKTFESIVDRIGKPLPGRINVIVTRQDLEIPQVLVFSDLNSAISHAKDLAVKEGQDEVIIGGGAQIYEQALPLCDRIYLTKVHQHVEGDAFFPEIDQTNWSLSEEQTFNEAPSKPSYTFLTLERSEILEKAC